MPGCPESYYTTDREAPESFLRKMKEYDSALFIRWNNPRQRFEVWRHTRKGKVFVMEVPYKYLDNRILNRLKESDTWYQGSKHNSLEYRMDEYNSRFEESRERDNEREFEAAGYDAWNASKRAFGNAKTRSNWNVPLKIKKKNNGYSVIDKRKRDLNATIV